MTAIREHLALAIIDAGHSLWPWLVAGDQQQLFGPPGECRSAGDRFRKAQRATDGG